jgi:hypothetical protein
MGLLWDMGIWEYLEILSTFWTRFLILFTGFESSLLTTLFFALLCIWIAVFTPYPFCAARLRSEYTGHCHCKSDSVFSSELGLLVEVGVDYD